MNKIAPALLVSLSAFALSSCVNSQQTKDILTVACAADAIAPVFVAGAGTVTTIIDPSQIENIKKANAADQAFHPMVQLACSKALAGSSPIQDTVTPVTVPVSPASP